MKENISEINLKIFLFSYVINPGAILAGLAIFGLILDKKPFDFLSSHSLTNYIFLVLGIALFLVNFLYILRLEKMKRDIKNKST